jgi:hypothetical protein
MAKLQLPDVTLIIIDTQCHDLARLAVEDSIRDIDFGDVIIFSDRQIEVAGTRWVQVSPWPSVELCCEFVWYELYKHIKTSHLLIVQWDGWILDVGCWRPEFLQYDYVGAPWWYDDPWNVGNGSGLRSIRLMRFLDENRQAFPMRMPEDGVLCRHYRPALEKRGFRWPSEQLAAQFAFECTRPSPSSRHFMFHDMFNFPLVLEGERLAERLRLIYANAYLKRGKKIAELESGRRPMIMPRLAQPAA